MTLRSKITMVMIVKRWIVCVLLAFAALGSCQNAGSETVVAKSVTDVREIVCYSVLAPSRTNTVTADKETLVAETYAEVGDRVAAGAPLLKTVKQGIPTVHYAVESGVVSDMAAPGASSDGKKPLCTWVNTDWFHITVLLRESDVSSVGPDNEVNVTTLSLGRTDPATVLKIGAIPEADGDGRYRALIELENRDEQLLPGMTVKVTWRVPVTAVILPHTAVGYDETGYYAYSDAGERIALASAAYCENGYAVTGIEPGTLVLRSVDRVAP